MPVNLDSRSWGSLSVGAPDNGALINGVQMRTTDLWYVRDPGDSWATEEIVFALGQAIQQVNLEFPDSNRVCIGDLSEKSGGPLDRHLSHQSGRDADVGWYFIDGPRTYLATGRSSLIDVPRSWALIRILIESGSIETILIDTSIQRTLYRHALAIGEDKEWLRGVFQVARGDQKPVIRHAPGHRNHFHARFKSPCAQRRAEKLRPLLVGTGLLPESKVVRHRASPGDNLWILARRYRTSIRAISQANGLESSLIRAGKVYRIPVGRR